MVNALVGMLRKIVNRGMVILRAIGAICLLGIVLTITAGIVSRYFFGAPFTWTEELATVLFIWLSFMGAGAVAGKRSHVAVDFLTSKFSPQLKNGVRIICDILIIILLSVMFLGGIKLLPRMTHVTVALGIPRYLNYIPVTVSSFYMILVYVEDLIMFFFPQLYEKSQKQDKQSKEEIA